MKLRISVPAEGDVAPDDEQILRSVEATAAQKASAWTAPTYLGYEDGAHVYLVDAVPRVPGVTMDNVSPVLRPARVIR